MMSYERDFEGCNVSKLAQGAALRATIYETKETVEQHHTREGRPNVSTTNECIKLYDREHTVHRHATPLSTALQRPQRQDALRS